MSLSGALSNALSGLTTQARQATLVSSNISNATTESYGRRTLDVSSRSTTWGGVSVDGVTRNTDAVVLADRRLSDAQLGYADDMQTFASKIEMLVGESGEAGSLTTLYSNFENALLSASSDPSSNQRLKSVALAAEDFTEKLNQVSGALQDARTDADKSIASDIKSLNDSLASVKQLNDSIGESVLRGADASSLMDERQRVLDTISEIVPLRTVARDNGTLAVYAASGTVLLDPSFSGQPAQIGFTPQEPITADRTLADGGLSGITINGHAINSTNEGPLGGGTLGAQLQIRDVVAVDMQAALDGIARDLVDRFGPGGADTTLAAGDAGLFTDAGLAFDPLLEVGLAARISLNSLVDPGGTGTWRLRDGLGAATQGNVGDATLIQGYSDALDGLSVPSSTSLGTGTSSFAGHVSDFVSAISAARVRADGEQSFSSAQHTALKELELSKGVDTDAELQDLLLIEQHYAANARVMTTVDELMQTLLSI
ncbi:flagellar biosynthesis protein FlgK [Salipiger aestuarii]|uniref:Flagellar hook-associated protein 1 n=1 Tax=Salipiger aestuarii TaxID=568098 RepID=A0A327YLW6_9RHOB|nr:flagellar hook-associated protein FlgK [Salipiger aestuarii]KAB2543100.1 flagellar biosynthesis protein FlgK [Salipiger aestuarii]RAK21412.1 flagellar hook-associated protein 1 FlgK [Salipiger aestuarii]